MEVEAALKSINNTFDIVLNKLRLLNKENYLLREENKELRNFIAELLIEQMESITACK